MAGRSDFDIKLLNKVRERPILWDSRCDDYKLSEKKPQEWATIAIIMNSDVKTVSERFYSMRGAYRRSIIKINKWNNRPSGSRRQRPRDYKYAAEMSFLADVFIFKGATDPGHEQNSDEESDAESQSPTDDGSVISLESSASNTKTYNQHSRKKAKTSDVGTAALTAAAVRSFEKFVTASVAVQRSTIQSPVAADLDDDWLFAMRLYNKLKAIPNGREKELFKCRFDMELVMMAYGKVDTNGWPLYMTSSSPPPPHSPPARSLPR